MDSRMGFFFGHENCVTCLPRHWNWYIPTLWTGNRRGLELQTWEFLFHLFLVYGQGNSSMLLFLWTQKSRLQDRIKWTGNQLPMLWTGNSQNWIGPYGPGNGSLKPLSPRQYYHSFLQPAHCQHPLVFYRSGPEPDCLIQTDRVQGWRSTLEYRGYDNVVSIRKTKTETGSLWHCGIRNRPMLISNRTKNDCDR